MRLIDANEVYKVLTDYYHQRTEIQHKALKEAIERVPTVEPKHGHWVYVGHGWAGEGIYKCSICGHQTPDDGNYCSNCGARMNEVENAKG